MFSIRKGICALAVMLLHGSGASGATFHVTNLDDSGPGTLRTAIQNANGALGGDIIDFTVSGSIVLNSALPAITAGDGGGTRIYGDTAPDDFVGPDIIIAGDGAGTYDGIVVNGADACEIRGLKVTGCRVGILVRAGAGVTVQSTRIGASGLRQLNELNGNTSDGIRFMGDCLHATIVRNFCVENGGSGIAFLDGPHDNAIGQIAAGNVVSANSQSGILFASSGAGATPRRI